MKDNDEDKGFAAVTVLLGANPNDQPKKEIK